MSSKKHLITTAIAYGNAKPHIGHAFEFVTADIHSRYRKLMGEEIHFITGMDEHGQKIEQKAKEDGIPVQEFVDTYAKSFMELDKELSIDYDFFVRTSDKKAHYKGAQTLWEKLDKAGAIELKKYTSLYCVGCEEFKKESDLNEKGECPLHLVKPEIVEEENYFFKLSKYSDQIKKAIENDDLKIYPETRKNEIMALIERGLEDVSFSRSKSKVSWGIPVPGDDTQVMYVWCDALSNYITAIGYGHEHFDKELWANTTHIIGKDILRFHAAIWPGMLIAAGLDLPKRILVHGFITSGGQKMSKTLGNTIDPQELLNMFRDVTDYPGDALRFILAHEVPSFEDGDLTLESIKTAYTAYLANGIGNLTNRVMKMAISNNIRISDKKDFLFNVGNDKIWQNYETGLKTFNPNLSIKMICAAIAWVDASIQQDQPFKLIKTNPDEARQNIRIRLEDLFNIAEKLEVFMPQTSKKILECIAENKMPEKPLFARLS